MRILTKFDIRNNNVVKGICYEGVEKKGHVDYIYNSVCKYIKCNVTENFEIILNDVTATLFNLNSGELDIKNILSKKLSLPHISSGGIQNIEDVNRHMSYGCDRIMINSIFFTNINIIKDIIEEYGAQVLIPTIEVRFINGDYYVYKCYGREETNIKLLDWIIFLKKMGIIELLLISIDKDGTLSGYDKKLLDYLKKNQIFNDNSISVLYAGGIFDIKNEINEISQKYDFIKGVSISTLFYNLFPVDEKSYVNVNNLISPIEKKIESMYFLNYIKGNTVSVANYYSKKYTCIFVDNVKDIPTHNILCIPGHYNTYKISILLKENNDFLLLRERLIKNTIKYLGICAGLQLLLPEVIDECSDSKIEGLNIIIDGCLKKNRYPIIGFIDNKFYCHSFSVYDKNCSKVIDFRLNNIESYQYHPENSNSK